MEEERKRKIRSLWNLATAVGHYAIALIAALSYAHIITPSNHLLAFLIAWANVCGAIHHFNASERDAP